MSTPGFGEAKKNRPQRKPESEGGGTGRSTRAYNPGKGVDRSLYIKSDWGLELYDLLEEIADMDDLTNEEGETTKDLDYKTRVLRGSAKVILERIKLAAGKGGLEGAIDAGRFVQIPVTRKEQNFLIEIGEYFDLDQEALDELRTLPAKGWY